ncbi:1-deoxy-D-xylulose-5-phosphate synthase [uncultured Tyzzerella sp.]|uniref:1-deoxy-D-xylulose-5-phosphate synthase n=1 Tax=uncultured Tyzzerella sp. TaxID=2321398 RepID=UPI002941F9CA|nr:1-deoxy-D-xylulose-5-phosphate synthase [uncultured Tyzzerella sp.]
MSYLDNINSPSDLKKLSIDKLDYLAEEIREFLIESLSKTGGHLSSNLGVVELTIALNYCFDFSIDKIVWDVGHQAYTHKILTGRKELFNTLRKKDGLSGFPKTKESIYDHFNTGHSSTSISAILGFATARDLLGKDYNVVSVIGDGAMTGGLVYEAMNNAGANNKKLLIILNDNQMSISENVGSMSKHLSSLRSAPEYIEVKLDVRQFLERFNIVGDRINKILEKTKEGIKYAVLPNVMFEQLGIKYIGPIDGHDIAGLIKAINNVKNINKPVLLHIITKKGYGYTPAENEPSSYHGVAPFNMETGKSINTTKVETYSDVFGKFMVREANKNKKLVAITAAMPSGTGLLFFKKLYPERLFDVGIAEEHAVIFSGGLAMSGFVPVFAVYSTFLQRGYDQIIHDICIQNLHVVFAIDRAGVVGDDGDTHQGIFDISYLSHIPNLTILAPKNKTEFLKMLDYSINKHNGPIAIRYPKGVANDTYSENEQEISFNKCEVIKQNGNIAIISVGTIIDNIKPTYEKLIDEGYNISLINARFISPIDKELINNIKDNFDYIFTVEDNVFKGGFGSNLISQLIKNEIFDKKIYNISFPDEYIDHATIKELHQKYGLDTEGIYKTIKNKIGNIENGK